jgi:hypothetical protein
VLFTFFWLLPVSAIWISKSISYPVAFGLIALGAVIMPLFIYNYCKMMSLALYYFFMFSELNIKNVGS